MGSDDTYGDLVGLGSSVACESGDDSEDGKSEHCVEWEEDGNG